MSKRSLFGRIKNIGKANAHAALENIEDAEKMLDQSVRDYAQNINEAEAAISSTIGNLRMAEDDHRKHVADAASWGSKAAAAAAKSEQMKGAGDAAGGEKFDALARAAIQRQIASEKSAGALTGSIESQRITVEKLKAGLTGMRAKQQDLGAKRNELVSRSKVAQAQNQVNDALKSIDLDSGTGEIGRFEEKIRREEAQVRGASELAASSLDAQFDALEDLGEQMDVEARLAALKAGAGQASIEG